MKKAHKRHPACGRSFLAESVGFELIENHPNIWRELLHQSSNDKMYYKRNAHELYQQKRMLFKKEKLERRVCNLDNMLKFI